MTEWFLAVGEVAIQAAIRVEGQNTSANNVTAKLAVQTAEVRTDSPSAWGLVSTGLTVTGSSNGPQGGSVKQTVSVGTAAMWVRWGVAVAMSGASSSGSADVTLAISTVSKGALVGTWRGQLLTAVSATEATVAVTGWIPVAWADEVYAAILVKSAGANFRARLVYRTAESSQNDPGAWNDTSDTTPTSTSERLVSDTGIGTTIGAAKQWVQFGITYWTVTSGTTTGDVAVTVAVRRA